jgi:hypothetical protein
LIHGAQLSHLDPFQGPARVGITDEEAREFTKFFSTIVEYEYFDSPELGSQLLLIPSNGRLNLTVLLKSIRQGV